MSIYQRFCRILFLGMLCCIPSIIYAQDTNQRIVNISGSYLNVPYQFDALGEGKQGEFNREPLYRFDKFDCETFVDTVLASALSHNVFEFEKYILDIRYQNGIPRFINRNHFPSADWIPNNIRKNYIRYLFIPNFVYSEIIAVIDKKSFYRNMGISRIKLPHLSDEQRMEKLNQLRSLSNDVENEIVHLYYVPFHLIPGIVKYIPNGSIIMIVKPENGVLISHMGFAVWKGNVLYLRAASSLKNRVFDSKLMRYLDYQSKMSHIYGIAIFTVNQE